MDTWSRLTRWAYALEGRSRWRIWLTLAVVAAALVTTVPAPWSWLATLPIVLLGVVLFDGQARRERDEIATRTTRK